MIYTSRITNIITSDKSKAGKPYVGFDGKPAKRIAMKTEAHPIWMSDFTKGSFDPRLTWATGMVVSYVHEKKGEFDNFRIPRLIDKLEADVKRIKDHLGMVDTDYSEGDIPSAESEDEPPF